MPAAALVNSQLHGKKVLLGRWCKLAPLFFFF
jgi:hypothetical protein